MITDLFFYYFVLMNMEEVIYFDDVIINYNS